MLSEQQLVDWLQAQPLDTPVAIDGESVYLKTYPDGAELGAHLMSAYTHTQLQRAMQQGFSSAINYDAGLGKSADGNSLVLTQWLRNVEHWSQVAKPLENLLNQLAPWRAAIAAAQPLRAPTVLTRVEHRLRMDYAKK